MIPLLERHENYYTFQRDFRLKRFIITHGVLISGKQTSIKHAVIDIVML